MNANSNIRSIPDGRLTPLQRRLLVELTSAWQIPAEQILDTLLLDSYIQILQSRDCSGIRDNAGDRLLDAVEGLLQEVVESEPDEHRLAARI